MIKTMTYAAIGALTLGMATAAHAEYGYEGNWYVGIQGGITMPGDETMDRGDAGLDLHQDLKTGWAAGLLGGYDFGNLRLEAEMTRRYNKMDQLEVLNAGGLGFPLGESDASGKTKANSLMMNVLVDWNGIGDGYIEPFFGGGLGVARLNYNNIASGVNALVDDKDTVMAYQAIAGLRYNISDAIEVALSYRYFKTEDAKLQDALNNDFRADYDSHDVMMSLVYRFGMKKEEVKKPQPIAYVEPEPAVAEIAPAAGPVEPMVNMGPYIVYFDFDAATLTPAAEDVIDDVTEAANMKKEATVHLKGYADRSGSENYNDKLASKRKDAVAAKLKEKGVAARRINAESFGESDPAVMTADGVREPMNRRVEINLE